MINGIRNLLWRILGIDHQTILKKLDYTLLRNDKFIVKGIGTYDNGAKVWRWTNAVLEIGNYCSIAHGVHFIVDEGYHNCSEITSYPFVNNLTVAPELVELRKTLNQKEGIIIGNDVWIGMNVVVLPGVKIGNGATIAAGSIVSEDVPDYAMVGGIPAKVIKMKHDEKIIKELNEIAWWDWDSDLIQKRKKDFYLPVQSFIEKYKIK